MVSSSDASAYLIEKSKKIKKESDDILEMVYSQLMEDGNESKEATAAAPSPAPFPPQSPEPSPSPTPAPVSSVPSPTLHTAPAAPPSSPSSSAETIWNDKEKVMKIVEFILTYMLSKQCNKESPYITASIEDTINFQKFMVSLENDLNSVLSSFKNNWDFIQSIDVEIDWTNNTIRIKPKQH